MAKASSVADGRRRQRFGGVLIGLTGVLFTLLTWRDALTTGQFSVRSAIAFPAFAVVGIALLLMPGYKEERRARGEDLAGKKGWRLLTLRWWIVLVVALAAGFLNLFVLGS